MQPTGMCLYTALHIYWWMARSPAYKLLGGTYRISQKVGSQKSMSVNVRFVPSFSRCYAEAEAQ